MSAPELSGEALAIWETMAEYWDEGVGVGGNKYWKRLQEPCLDRLLSGALGQPSGCRVLELATGNGLCARWLARRGATVVATDGSQSMLDRAAAHGTEGGRISFAKLDVTVPTDFERVVSQTPGGSGFDIVLINMALMDIATLEPLAAALPTLLKENGVFVAMLLHPVFFTSGAARKIELTFHPVTGDLEVSRTKVIKDYLDIPPVRGLALPGQPVRQIYFHRPICALLAPFFEAGLFMDALEEPAFTEQDKEEDRVQASTNYTQLPALLAFRLRRSR